MEHKHTPGPWGWSHREIPSGNYSTQVYDANEKEIATIAWYPVRQNNITTTSREANARLIAAAPDLLQSCRGMLHALETDCRDTDKWAALMGEAVAVIAKATGA